MEGDAAKDVWTSYQVSRNGFNERLRKIKSILSMFSAAIPSVPTANPAEATRTQARSTFERRLIPKFSGEPRDTRFRSRWKEVAREYSEESQLDFILDQRSKIKLKINTCRKMSEVWERLDNDFGKPDKVGACCIQGMDDLSINARNE